MLDVIVLNAYHRGDWLIEQFKSREAKIQVLDVSAMIGEREDADIFGPFGFFSGSNPGIEEWLTQHHQLQLQTRGWTLWSENGTFESAGMIHEFQAQQGGEVYQNILKSWHSHLDRPSKFLAATKGPGPSEGGFYIHRAFAKSKNGAAAVKTDDVVNFSTEPGKKIVTWNDTTYESHFVISFLLPHEAMACAESGFGKLLTGEALRPRLCWQRARVNLKTTHRTEILPDHLLYVNRLDEPWIEDNFLILQKTADAGGFDIWYRGWFEVHKEPSYFAKLSDKMAGRLREKMPDLEMKVVKAPTETEAAMATLFPIYDIQEWGLQTKWFANGIYSAWLDKCESFSLASQIDLQMMVLRHLDEELKGG